MRHFIFLEFLDPRVESTLRELRDALQPKGKPSGPVHITVRGPYKTEPDPDHMRELSEHLRGRGVRLMGVGIFSTPKGYSVFLRAESSAFRELWWKPDFQTPIDEIQPHLTLYESEHRAVALLALNFLRASRISILTYAVQLSIYSSGQGDLFGTRPVAESPPNKTVHRDIVAIDSEVIPAARELGLRLADMVAEKRIRAPLPNGKA
jgi:hypothetical protein